jgi:outer membrane protein OmpA-like peptidoglycan-associated protein
MSTSAHPLPGSWRIRGLVLSAAAVSLLLHGAVLYGFHRARLGFGPPLVDPIEPKRFHLERATIDPARLEPEPRATTSSTLPPAQRDIALDPDQIAAFSGPLQAPRMPAPSIPADLPASLSLDASPVPVDAFSALPLETEGNLPQLAQALTNEAGTAALRELNRTLQGSLAGGGDGAAVPGSGAVPKFEDISSAASFRPPDALERPAFQPILLRLSSDVLFEFDSATLQPSAYTSLERVAQALRNAVRTVITIEGHTDTIGDEAYNLRLSEQRAAAVAAWLKQQPGLGSKPMSVKGYGETRPIVAPNGSIAEQKQNRRVEIRIEAER